MTETEIKLQREVKELRGEVRRLKTTLEWIGTIVGLIALLLFPVLILVGLLILVALYVSPVRHVIFPPVFSQQGLSPITKRLWVATSIGVASTMLFGTPEVITELVIFVPVFAASFGLLSLVGKSKSLILKPKL